MKWKSSSYISKSYAKLGNEINTPQFLSVRGSTNILYIIYFLVSQEVKDFCPSPDEFCLPCFFLICLSCSRLHRPFKMCSEKQMNK